MHLPFKAADWVPSKAWDPWNTPHTKEQTSDLIAALQQATEAILKHPYDATSWIRRSRVLASLRYPELAVGDATKARLLIKNILGDLEHERRPNFRVGYRMGFWMRDEGAAETGELDEEHERQEETFAQMQSEAEKVAAENLEYWPCEAAGRFTPLRYPWIRTDWDARSDELLDTINGEFADPKQGCVGERSCLVKRYAFGKGVGAQDGYDLLGVFAARNILEDEVILVDSSRVWVWMHIYRRCQAGLTLAQGCNGPGSNGSRKNLFGGHGCMDEIHPSKSQRGNSANVGHLLTLGVDTADDDAELDLRWIRDRFGRFAADRIMKVRLLLCCVQDGANHPLNHSLAARLTPNYVEDKMKKFSVEKDMAVFNDALQKFGIDIFANLAYDTWVLFTLQARLDNNSWSDPMTACTNGLFCLFNHSCEPNIEWQSQQDHTKLTMTALRDIKAGEQLFVNYDCFTSSKPLQERRNRFWRWLNGPCQCSKCLREEAEEGGRGEDAADASFSSGSSWDVDEKVRLPEDEFERRDSLTSACSVKLE